MVDKSFLRGELFVLRCSFKNLLMLRSILIGSLSYERFYAKDGLDFPLAHGYRSVRPTRLGPLGLVFCFSPLHEPCSTTFCSVSSSLPLRVLEMLAKQYILCGGNLNKM